MGGRSQVGRPSEPPSVAGIDIHINVECCQLLDSINDTLFVRRLGTSALRLVEVGHQVG